MFTIFCFVVYIIGYSTLRISPKYYEDFEKKKGDENQQHNKSH